MEMDCASPSGRLGQIRLYLDKQLFYIFTSVNSNMLFIHWNYSFK